MGHIGQVPLEIARFSSEAALMGPNAVFCEVGVRMVHSVGCQTARVVYGGCARFEPSFFAGGLQRRALNGSTVGIESQRYVVFVRPV